MAFGVLDVIGFLIIAFEWRHTYLHSVFLREAQVQEDHDRTKADEQGKNYEEPTPSTTYSEHADSMEC